MPGIRQHKLEPVPDDVPDLLPVDAGGNRYFAPPSRYAEYAPKVATQNGTQ